MNERTVWLTPDLPAMRPTLALSLDAGAGRLDLHYEAAGCQSRWVILHRGTVLAYASDYTEARERAQAIARSLRRRAA